MSLYTLSRYHLLYEVTPPGMAELTLQSKDQDIYKRIRFAGVTHAHAFPVVIGGHPQPTLYALAEQAARRVER